MATKASMKCCDGDCGMHICGKCSLGMLIFGILFLIAGFGLWTNAPVWFNGWSVLGAFMAIWGLIGMMMKK